MKRRDFVRLTGTGLTAGALAEAAVSAQMAARPAAGARASSRARMKAGTQHGDSDPILRAMAGFGVNHICSRLPSPQMGPEWSVEELTKRRERVESFGLTLDMVPLPLSSSEISRSESPAIMLGKEPDRQKQIDGICEMIRNVSRAGIPSVKYNMTFIGVPRTAPTVGRGKARYSTFVYAGAPQDPPLTEAGPVNADLYWERITYFLERVVPVAAEHKVKLACHPQDPGMPRGKGWRGDRDGARHGRRPEAVRLDRGKPVPRPELLPGHGVGDAGEAGRADLTTSSATSAPRKKIFNVHFRNIAGGFLNFRETFIDDGDVDMLRAMRVYREVGYDGMMMPDHVPYDRRRHRQRAGLRLRMRLHQGADCRGRRRVVTGPGNTIPAVAFCVVAGLLGLRAAGQEAAGWQANPQLVDQETVRQKGVNYTESRVGTFELPDPLAGARGRVRDSAGWAPRRAEILELFREHVYGRSPGKPDRLTFEEVERNDRAMDGAATLQRVAIVSTRQGRTHRFQLTLFLSESRSGTAGFRCSCS